MENLLSEIPVFRDMDEDLRLILMKNSSVAKYQPNHIIFREGDEADKFYLLRSGKVELEIFSHDRGRDIIQTLNAGEIFGWSSLIPPHTWYCDARTVEPAELIILDGKYLRKMCDENHEFGYHLMKRVSYMLKKRLRMSIDM
jgi:CRP-like cAMP-binding protein